MKLDKFTGLELLTALSNAVASALMAAETLKSSQHSGNLSLVALCKRIVKLADDETASIENELKVRDLKRSFDAEHPGMLPA